MGPVSSTYYMAAQLNAFDTATISVSQHKVQTNPLLLTRLNYVAGGKPTSHDLFKVGDPANTNEFIGASITQTTVQIGMKVGSATKVVSIDMINKLQKSVTLSAEFDVKAFSFMPGGSVPNFLFAGQFTGSADTGDASNSFSFSKQVGFVMHSNPPVDTNC